MNFNINISTYIADVYYSNNLYFVELASEIEAFGRRLD